MRDRLPFREKSELFLLTASGEVLAQDRGSYCMFVGGGKDDGETAMAAGKREALEEVGAVTGALTHLGTVDFVWFPAWANNKKRKARYAEYQGERVHMFVGRCVSVGKSTGDEGDSWTGRKSMSIKKCISLCEKYGAKDHKNTYAYRVAQLMALRSLALL